MTNMKVDVLNKKASRTIKLPKVNLEALRGFSPRGRPLGTKNKSKPSGMTNEVAEIFKTIEEQITSPQD